MSQSDYIKRKRVSTQVASKYNNPLDKIDNPPILNSQLLTSFNEYDLENTIVNTRPRFNQLVPSSDLIVMKMNLRQPQSVTTGGRIRTTTYLCKTYRTCNGDNYNTSTLPGRVPVNTFIYGTTNVPFVYPNDVYTVSKLHGPNQPNPTLGPFRHSL